jgi:hypothetical protein
MERAVGPDESRFSYLYTSHLFRGGQFHGLQLLYICDLIVLSQPGRRRPHCKSRGHTRAKVRRASKRDCRARFLFARRFFERTRRVRPCKALARAKPRSVAWASESVAIQKRPAEKGTVPFFSADSGKGDSPRPFSEKWAPVSHRFRGSSGRVACQVVRVRKSRLTAAWGRQAAAERKGREG